jgi:hypothetical protein
MRWWQASDKNFSFKRSMPLEKKVLKGFDCEKKGILKGQKKKIITVLFGI